MAELQQRHNAIVAWDEKVRLGDWTQEHYDDMVALAFRRGWQIGLSG